MLDLVFPSVCLFCESVSERKTVCDICLSDIRFIKERVICLKCGVPFGFTPEHTHKSSMDSVSGHLCGRCLLDEFYFHKARSVAFYEGLLRDILHKFKYEGKLNLGDVISDILIENFPNDLDEVDIIIPVPLHISKLRRREYNQSVVLGMNLAKHLKVSFNPFVLKKIRDTRPQVEIKNEDERRKNIKGAFSVVDSEKIRKRSVLLIDDVFTTGSTINECTRTLLGAGALRVQAITLMRAVQD
jgi:ComF family protein